MGAYRWRAVATEHAVDDCCRPTALQCVHCATPGTRDVELEGTVDDARGARAVPHEDRAAVLRSEQPSAAVTLSEDAQGLELTKPARFARKAACSTVSAPSETYTAPPSALPLSVGCSTATSPDMLTCRSTSVTPAPTASTRDDSGVRPCPRGPCAWPWMTTALVAVQEGTV